MINNKFIIITTCYNVAKWLPINIEITKAQSYKNFICLLVNDKSTDDTSKIIFNHIGQDSRFQYTHNTNNGSQSKAYMWGLDFLENHNMIEDEDVIVEVDGDDWLSSVFVLEYLNNIYQDRNILMTYGQYQLYPSGYVGGHYNMRLTSTHNCRQQPFPYSHLKTYKYSLLKKINRQDLIDPNTNEYYSAAWDHVLCMPMVEMAGASRIHRCDDILYVLNRSDELQNEGKSRVEHQKSVEQCIRSKKPYNIVAI